MKRTTWKEVAARYFDNILSHDPMPPAPARLDGQCLCREDLVLENLALCQQLLALHVKRPRRRLTVSHKLFWIALRSLWSGWKKPLILVTPRTVVDWHRAGFRLYWKWRSRAKPLGGMKPTSIEIRALVFRMAKENPTWGAPRIHGELLMLGFNLSETTVSRWLRQAPRTPNPAKRGFTFLRNHRAAIAAMDFFTVPTLTFGVLYCFFIVGHDRRKILRCHVTRHPTALWIVQQMKPGRTYRCTDSCYSTATRSLAMMWSRRRRRWEACLSPKNQNARAVSRSVTSAPWRPLGTYTVWLYMLTRALPRTKTSPSMLVLTTNCFRYPTQTSSDW